MSAQKIVLVVRLGAMGDIIHTLPAAASLKQSFPHHRLIWAAEERWTPLLDDNPFVDGVLAVRRTGIRDLIATGRELRRLRPALAVDFQGLLKSAFTASLSRPDQIAGFDASEARERAAALFYSHAVKTSSAHAVDRNLELARQAGASSLVKVFPIPRGRPEGNLPSGFVLANPMGGWVAKQWPLEYYAELGRLLRRDCGLELVLNGPAELRAPNTRTHVSSIAGLIDATRRAAGVVGIDSGPVHLAAALGKPGVAIFGPTDPARNGPYGATFTVLRGARARTSYKRRDQIDSSMRDITPDQAFESLRARMLCAASSG